MSQSLLLLILLLSLLASPSTMESAAGGNPNEPSQFMAAKQVEGLQADYSQSEASCLPCVLKPGHPLKIVDVDSLWAGRE